MNSVLHTKSTRREVPSQMWHSEIISGGYTAAIFDCDGTLVDSSEAHFQAFQLAVQTQGFEMQRDWYNARTGLDRTSILTEFGLGLLGNFDPAKAIAQSIREFIALSETVQAIPQTEALVRKLGFGFPMAVGTNSEKPLAEATLRATNLRDYFVEIVSVSDNLAPKPAPDIFAQAARTLSHPAANTLVFEDSAEGVRAAMAAGLDVIEITD